MEHVQYVFEEFCETNLKYPIMPYRNFIKELKSGNVHDLPYDARTMIICLEKAKSLDLETYQEDDEAVSAVREFIAKNGWVVLK